MCLSEQHFQSYDAMKKVFHYCILPLLYISFLTLLIIFRIQFVSSIWQDYRVLAVPAAVSEKDVLKTLEECGIKDTISISSESMCPKNEITPVTGFELAYKEAIQNYFFDESKSNNLYYIHESANLGTRLKTLMKKVDADWKVERISVFALLILIFPFGFSIVFFVLSKRKLLYTFLQLPFLVFCCGSAEFAAALCASVFPIVAYSIQYYWQRPGWVHFLIGDLVTVVLVLAMLSSLILTVPFSRNLRIVFLGLSAFAGAACALWFFYFIDQNKTKTGFILINSANTVAFSLKSKLEFLALAVLTFGVLCLSFIAKDRFFSSGGLKGLSIPAPHEYAKSGVFSYYIYENLVTSENQTRTLPDLADFVTLYWKTEVFPYVSLNEKFPQAYSGSEVSVPVYEYDEDSGRVSTERKILYTFDESYFSSVLLKVASQTEPSVEKLLFAQKHFVTVAYKQFR